MKDGACQSKTKAGTITAAKTKIVIKSIPNGDSPGKMEVQCSMSMMSCTATGNSSIVRAGLLGNMLLATLWLL